MSHSTTRKQSKGKYKFRIKQRELHYDDPMLNPQSKEDYIQKKFSNNTSDINKEDSKEEIKLENIEEESGSVCNLSKRRSKEITKGSELIELANEI